MKYTFGILGVISLVMTSCATSEYYMADDAYVVKPSDLPVGESTADETSYAAFKKRKGGETNEQLTYQDNWHALNNRRCLSEPIWYDGCGCSFSYWSAYSPYSSMSRVNGPGYSNWWHSSMYYNPYMVWGPNGYNAFVIGMNYYTSPYYPYYGYNPGMSYGWGYNPYGYYYGGGGYGYGGSHAQNVHYGPRGSVAGYSNPTGRTATGKLKSSNTVASTGTATANAPLRSRHPVDNNNAYRTPSTVTHNVGMTNQRPVGNRQISSGRDVSRTYGTTYSRPDGQVRQPARTNSTYNSTSRSSGGGNILNSGSSSRTSGSGNVNYSSGSSSRSGSGSSSGSSSRSGSSGTTHSGRR